MSAVDSGHPGYLPALDGMRACSILIVLLSHAWLGQIVPGGLGVTMFFFISGFIITRLMLAEWARDGRLDIAAFYVRRLCRITPALIAFVACSLVAMRLVGAEIRATEIAAVFLYAANYYDIFVGFGVGQPLYPFPITWSLAVEEHYYFVFPFLFVLLVRHRMRFMALIVVLVLAALMWRYYLDVVVGFDNLRHNRIYKATDTRFDSILYGALFALLLEQGGRIRQWLARPITFWFGAALMLGSLVLRDAVFRETLRYAMQGVALICMMSTLVLVPSIWQRLLSTPVMRYVGRISYSLYLFHWLVLGLIELSLGDKPYVLRFTILMVGSFAAAHLSYRFVEIPGQRLRKPLLHALGISTRKVHGG